MENESNLSTDPQEENTVVYIVAAVIVVAVIVAAVLMWPKNKQQEQTLTPTTTTQATPTPNQTPIAKFACENQWFNPVIGIPKYYLSAQVADVRTGGTVDCTFTLYNGSTTVLTEKMTTVPLVAAPERNGSVVTCTTKALENIPKNVGLTMISVVKNDEGKVASCSGTVTFR